MAKRFGPRLIDKELWKLVAGHCRICKKEIYAALDCHRIVPGEKGGTYTTDNVVVLCAVCHRYVHDKMIVIHGWVHSTAGKLLHITRGGVEEFL